MSLIRQFLLLICQKAGVCPVNRYDQLDRFDYKGGDADLKTHRRWQDRYQNLMDRQKKVKGRLQESRAIMVRTDVKARKPLSTEVVDNDLQDPY